MKIDMYFKNSVFGGSSNGGMGKNARNGKWLSDGSAAGPVGYHEYSTIGKIKKYLERLWWKTFENNRRIAVAELRSAKDGPVKEYKVTLATK